MEISPSKTEETSELIDALFLEMQKYANFQEKLIKYTDVGMVIISKNNGQFIFANPAAQKIYNRTLEELQQFTLTTLTEIDTLEETQKALYQVSNHLVHCYKLAKVYVIPPDNSRKIAFMEIAEISTEKNFPYLLGILIEKSQLEFWLNLVNQLN